MKNVLIFSCGRQGYQEACQLEAANEYYNNGDNVLFVTCGSKTGMCNENNKGDKIRCLLCKKMQQHRINKFVSKNLKRVSIDTLITKEIEEDVSKMSFDYCSLSDIQSLQYCGVEIGYGALSSYVSSTRNIEIDFNSQSIRLYIDFLLRMQVKMIMAAEVLFDSFNPDLVVVHNGRFAHFKPFYGLAKAKKIDYVITETITDANNIVRKEFFLNGIPHNVDVRDKMIREFWEKSKGDKDREHNAILFYENRKHAKYAGDKIYVKDQKFGKLPADWDESKENIVIFNSSEDEFFAIGSEVNNKSLFDNQFDGIKKIIEHYKEDKTKHFTLRVHPNLKGLPYHYHQDLYTLSYPNLTVIHADSDISSYSVLDAADKVIVFGSTMGIEATFWGKPTINLAYALYEYMDVTYYPKEEKELWCLIDNKDLVSKDPSNALMYGLYFVSDKHEPFRFINVGRTYTYNILGHVQSCFRYYTLLGSKRLYIYMEKLLQLESKYISLFSKFKSVPK